VLTEAGLPGWFPADFNTDPKLQAAFEDNAGWHKSGKKSRKNRKAKNNTADGPESAKLLS